MQSVQRVDFPLSRKVDEVPLESGHGVDRRVLFSPTTVGSRYMKFVLVYGQPGSESDLQALPGDQMTLTLEGRAVISVADHQYALPIDAAIMIPAETAQKVKVSGDDQWVAITASCDECPLMRAHVAKGSFDGGQPNVEEPLVRQVDKVEPERLYGFERRVLFSPSTVGSRYMKFAKVRGKPGAKSVAHTHPGGEMALTLQGNAQLIANGEHFDLRAGSAFAVPPAVKHPAQATGNDEWIVVTSYCDECPLMKAQLLEERQCKR